MIQHSVVSMADFNPDKMAKVTIAGGEYLFAGLNCFEPGQEHPAHVHADQDKLYVVIAGEGEAVVGESKDLVGPGDIVFAHAGAVHSLRNTSSTRRLVVIAVLGPAPHKR